MKVLITGENGQLGQAFSTHMHDLADIKSLSKQEMDVTNPFTVEKIIQTFRPNYVIHTAAYTAVDQSEKNPKHALEVNAIGAWNIARSCRKYGAIMLHFSTDYVFNGKKETPYVETDHPNPQNIYGLSKWLGEEFVLQTAPESYVIRTSWLYGHGGKNFVNTMKDYALRKKQIQVVDDQIGSPTYANDLVKACIELLEQPFGIYHIRNQGSCSWYTFARAIYKEIDADPDLVMPIATKDYGALAPRPAYSVLSMDKLVKSGIAPPRSWRDALVDFVEKE